MWCPDRREILFSRTSSTAHLVLCCACQRWCTSLSPWISALSQVPHPPLPSTLPAFISSLLILHCRSCPAVYLSNDCDISALDISIVVSQTLNLSTILLGQRRNQLAPSTSILMRSKVGRKGGKSERFEFPRSGFKGDRCSSLGSRRLGVGDHSHLPPRH